MSDTFTCDIGKTCPMDDKVCGFSTMFNRNCLPTDQYNDPTIPKIDHERINSYFKMIRSVTEG